MSDDIGRREFLKRTTATSVLGAGALAAVGVPAVDAFAASPPLPEPARSAAIADRHLDSRDFCLSAYDAIAPAHTFVARDAAAARRWQRRARERVVARLGGFPATRVPLRADVLETRDMGTYTREKIVFDTRERLSAVGYLLLPKDRPRPLPAIVALPGHGRGLVDVVGIASDGTQQAERTGYAHQYAVQCVERGYATFAIEQLGFGERRDAAARRASATADSCRPAACTALLLGETMAAWRTWDAMRAIDYLVSRPEIDAARIATLGASGGGTIALLTAALDPRVRAGVVSAYFNTFRDSIVQISHCPDNYVPGLLREVELYDLAGLVAPRALFVESGEADRIFPVAGFRAAVAKASDIYRVFGASEAFGSEVHAGGHEFGGVGAFAFLTRRL